MFYKQCTLCHETSYSASDVGDWRCPNCGADLTLVKAYRNVRAGHVNRRRGGRNERPGRICSLYIQKSLGHGF